MSEIALVYVLFGDRAAAETAARSMVERRLAACANILGDCASIYPWDGKIEQTGEIAVLLKTMPARRAALMDALGEAHAYELPAILSWPAITTPAYAAWVAENVQVS